MSYRDLEDDREEETETFLLFISSSPEEINMELLERQSKSQEAKERVSEVQMERSLGSTPPLTWLHKTHFVTMEMAEVTHVSLFSARSHRGTFYLNQGINSAISISKGHCVTCTFWIAQFRASEKDALSIFLSGNKVTYVT